MIASPPATASAYDGMLPVWRPRSQSPAIVVPSPTPLTTPSTTFASNQASPNATAMMNLSISQQYSSSIQ